MDNQTKSQPIRVFGLTVTELEALRELALRRYGKPSVSLLAKKLLQAQLETPAEPEAVKLPPPKCRRRITVRLPDKDRAYLEAAAEQRRGGRDAGYLLGVGLVLWAFWIIGVGVGHVFGATVRLPPGHPLYFAAIATFCAILVPVWQGVRRDLLPWTLAAAVALLAWAAGLAAPWPLLAGALSGAALGAWLELRRA